MFTPAGYSGASHADSVGALCLYDAMFYEQRGGHIRVLPGAPAGTFFWQWQGEHLLSPTRQPDVPAVTGLIFHLARCGSTLLARLLAEDPNTLVLNEPDVLNTLLLAGMASDFVDPRSEEHTSELQSQR